MLFEALSDGEIEKIVHAMKVSDYEPGQAVIRQGDVGDNFYVVKSGKYDVYLKSVSMGTQSVKQYAEGAAFGELALMYNTPRAATVRCTAPG